MKHTYLSRPELGEECAGLISERHGREGGGPAPPSWEVVGRGRTRGQRAGRSRSTMPCADPVAMAAAQASATTATMGGHGRREDEGAEGRPRQIRHALHGSGRHGRRAGLRHRRRYGRGREEGGGRRRGRRAGRCRHGWAWEEGGLGGGPAAAAMGGRGTREEDGAEGRRCYHGRAREEEWEWGGGRRPEGGRKKIPEREREGRMKKISGEHITAGSYYNPAVMLT